MTPIEDIIAQGLTQLVAAVNANTLALQQRTPSPDAASKTPKAKAPTPPPAAEAPKPLATDESLRLIQDLGMKLIKDGKQAAVKEVLKAHGAETFVQVPGASRAAVKEQLELLLAPAPAAKPVATVTIDQVKSLATPLLAREGAEYKFPKAVAAIRALLVTYKVAKISEVKEADLAAFHEDLETITAAQTSDDDDLS